MPSPNRHLLPCLFSPSTHFHFLLLTRGPFDLSFFLGIMFEGNTVDGCETYLIMLVAIYVCESNQKPEFLKGGWRHPLSKWLAYVNPTIHRGCSCFLHPR